MRRVLPWLVPPAVVAVIAIAVFWTNLPEWGYCIEEGPYAGCENGTFTSNAIAGTIVLIVALTGQAVAAFRARGPRRTGILIASSAAFVVLLLVALMLQFVPLGEVPMPI